LLGNDDQKQRWRVLVFDESGTDGGLLPLPRSSSGVAPVSTTLGRFRS
jgi:hypothetical protein